MARFHVNTHNMSWKNRGGDDGRRGYHHGNLREALIRGALELIAQKGPAGFTIAEAARSAGVSPAAPYRHFRDRDELMADVARRGFEQFEAAPEGSVERRPAQPVAGVRGSWAAPISPLPATSPPITRRCSSPARPPGATPELRQAAMPPSACCATPARRSVRPCRQRKRPPALMVALHIWSMAHGIASLFGRPDAGNRPMPMSPEELLEAAVLVYFQGLGITPAAGATGM